MTVPNPITQCCTELEHAGRPVMHLYSGNPTAHDIHFPTDILHGIYADYLRTPHYAPHPQGDLQAREAIATYYAQHGATVDPAHVIMTPGTSDAFSYLCKLLTQPGDHILAPCPSYPLFHDVAHWCHIELKPYPLVETSDWRIDLDALRAAMTPRTRAILLISPHNPTGMVANPEELRAITALANRHGLALIVDEVFSPFYFGTETSPRAMTVAPPELCFTLNGISKLFALPAWKLGWIAVTGIAARVVPAVERLAQIADTFLSCHDAIQRGLPRLFTEGAAFAAQYQGLLQERYQALSALRATLPPLHISLPEGGFYFTARWPAAAQRDDESLVCDLMRTHGYFFHPGYLYDIAPSHHVVASLLSTPEDLRAGLKALQYWLYRSRPDPTKYSVA